MKRTGRYNILKNATELINKHMDSKLIVQKGTAEIEQALIKAYKSAETALMTHIKQELQQIKDIDSLTHFFRESCYGLGALGLRHDLLKKNLIGNRSAGAEALREAIEEGVEDEDSFPHFGIRCGDSKGFSLSNEAFDNGLIGASETNKRSLVTMLLLDYVVNKGYEGLKIASVIADMEFSCSKMLLDNSDKERSLLGYYEGYEYVIEGANKEFISLFASTLIELLAQKESAQVLEMKHYLQEQVITVWTGCSFAKPIEIYIELERLIAANKTSEWITHQIVEDLIYSKGFAVRTRYSETGLSYELNVEGLNSFVALLETLGLGDLQEVKLISDRIKEAIA